VIEIRPSATPGEEQLSLEIYNTVWPKDAVSMANVESFKKGSISYVDLIAYQDGTPGGCVAGAILRSRPRNPYVLLTVLSERRRRGLGTALYRALSEWLRPQGVHELHGPVSEDDAESLAFAERRGFVEIARDSRMILELGSFEPPSVDPPEGIEIITWAERPELASGLYEVACESFPDVPGDEDRKMESYDDWLRIHMQGSGDRPDATFVALADSEVIGYAKFSLTEAQPTVAIHDMTGVKRAWRGRGVAGALKRAELAWAKRAGFERLQTTNEVRNEPIRRINQRLGYRAEPGRVTMRGPLAS
jgi:GNAT superfamily N-acetyltransferase